MSLVEAVHNKIIELDNVITSVSFSPDGKFLAIASWNNEITIWKTQDGSFVHILEGHEGSVNSVAWSLYIASGSEDNTVRVWDINGGSRSMIFKGHTNSVNSVAWSPDGNNVVSGSTDKTVRVWNILNGTCVKIFRGHTDSVTSVAWNPDSIHIASGSNDKSVRIWKYSIVEVDDYKLNKLYNSLKPSRQEEISSLGERDARLILTQVFQHKNNSLATLKTKDSVLSIAFSPNGKNLIGGSRDDNVWLWKLSSNSWVLHKKIKGHKNNVTCVQFSPTGKYFASGSHDSTVRVWDALSLNCVSIIHEDDEVNTISFNSHPQLFVESEDQMDLLMNELTGIGLNQPTTSQGEKLLYIACGSSDNEVNCWSVNTLNSRDINHSSSSSSSAARNVLMELGGSKTRRKNKRRKSKTLRRK